MRKYPDYAIERLKTEYDRLEESFARLWGALSPSVERDEIMWHILTAKKKITELIKEQEELNNESN